MTPLRFLLIALLTALGSIAHAGETLVTFASGRAEVILPDNFTVVSSDTSGLVATFGPKRDHKLELSLNDIESSLGSADLGEQFVRAQAEKKGRKLSLGAGRVVFMDPAGPPQGADTGCGCTSSVASPTSLLLLLVLRRRRRR